MTRARGGDVHTCGLDVRSKEVGPSGGSAMPPRMETAGTLPKMLRGSIHTQWVTCGKSGCRYARGELHGPYYYLFQRTGGRLHKTYVS